MNKKIGIAAVIILIIIFVIVAKKGGTGNISKGENGQLKGEYSLQDIINLKNPYECTFMKNDGASNLSGHVRIAESKVRADLDIEYRAQDGGNFASHFIMMDGLSYIWTSLQSVGYKAKIAESSGKRSSPADQAQILGLDDKMDYNCAPWNADLNAFKLPQGITFLEVK